MFKVIGFFSFQIFKLCCRITIIICFNRGGVKNKQERNYNCSIFDASADIPYTDYCETTTVTQDAPLRRTMLDI
jgi:hypothetical protein